MIQYIKRLIGKNWHVIVWDKDNDKFYVYDEYNDLVLVKSDLIKEALKLYVQSETV